MQNMEAKVTDFGMAKQAANGETHMSTRVMGTMGYLDPAYMETGRQADGRERPDAQRGSLIRPGSFVAAMLLIALLSCKCSPQCMTK